MSLTRFSTALLILAFAASCAPQMPAYSGTVQTESVAVGSLIGGRVAHVYVVAGMRVRRGTVLLNVDPSMLQAQYDQSTAQLRQAAGRLTELESGSNATSLAYAGALHEQAAAQYSQTVAQVEPQLRQQAAAVRDAEAALALARVTYVRNESLAASGDISQQSLDQARSDYRQAVARLTQQRAAYMNLIQAQLPGARAVAQAGAAAQAVNVANVENGRTQELAQAQAAVEAARAAVAYDRSRLDEAVITSPADGVVASFNLHPGDLLVPNQQAAIIDTFANPYAYIYASQGDLDKLAYGAHLQVISDETGKTYRGTVEAHDRTAQFTPQNVETADQRAELVYGVKVRIADPNHELLDGTTVTVYAP